MIQLACLLLCLIATNQTFSMILNKDKIKDAIVLIVVSGVLDAIGWWMVLDWSF
jgi:hypothetical protein